MLAKQAKDGNYGQAYSCHTENRVFHSCYSDGGNSNSGGGKNKNNS